MRVLAFGAVSLCVWVGCTAIFFNGHTDDFYERIASPRQASLIVGSSRAAQGLLPGEIDARALGADAELFNFAFTSATSRYGPAYLEAIQRKLVPASAARGVFLLEVSPLAISKTRGERAAWPEDQTFLARLHSVSLEPNIEYPFYAVNRGYDIIDRSVRRWRGQARLYLHADGWLEVKPSDDGSIEARIDEKLRDIGASLAASEYSPERFAYLERTLALLTLRGRAALVMMPLAPRVREIERGYMPDFDDRMRALAERSNVSYLDLSDLDAQVLTNDGSHLRRESARRVSREVFARLAHAWSSEPAP